MHAIYILFCLPFQIQELGLQVPYINDEGTFKFLRKLMALPFLPYHNIQRTFNSLKDNATTNALEDLVEYIENQWIKSTVFAPKDWSIYGQPVRTNNDIEGINMLTSSHSNTQQFLTFFILLMFLIFCLPLGWHHGLNRRAMGRHLPFYELIELLYREARFMQVQVYLVSIEKLTRIQRKKYKQLQTKIFGLWDKYENGQKTDNQLLKAVSRLNGPTRAI